MCLKFRSQITFNIALSCVGLLMGLRSSTAAAQPPSEEIHVTGTVQFWKRDCPTLQTCSLPVAISPHYSVDTKLKRPKNDHEISYWKDHLPSEEQDALQIFVGQDLSPQLTLEVYWRSAKDDPKGRYLSFQMLFTHQKQISSCSQYVAESEVAFPAGYCSVFIPKDGQHEQFGVSFYHSDAVHLKQ